MADFDDNTEPNGISTATKVALPAAAVALGGTVLFGIVGFAAGWFLHSPDAVEVARAPTAEELAEACEPEVAEVEDELTAAQTRVMDLERESAEKERQVSELEAKIARGAEAGAALRAELAAVKAELEETKEELRVAVEEKERVLEELRLTEEELAETRKELVVAVEQRDEAREDALYNRWTDFVSDAQLEICDRGNRKKMGKCRETVVATIDTVDFKDKFGHCLRSGQAEPRVAELDKDMTMPQHAQMLPDEVRQVKGYFVEFCDPTLPERSDISLAEGRLPKTNPSSG